MEEADRSQEFEAIVEEQARLRGDLAKLDRRICEMREGRDRAKSAEPSLLEEVPAKSPLEAVTKARREPPPIPEVAEEAERPPFSEEPDPTPSSLPKSMPVSTATAEQADDLEMRIGTVWFVRLGVVMLLTGLVFLSRYVYSAWINDLPPVAKVVGLFALSGTLAGAGIWLEFGKRALERMRTFAQVLTGGGLAAIYYTTYAMHHVEALRVVDNPIVAGAFLLAAAAVIFGYAMWRKSQTVAVVAIVLAYYSAAITPVGWFAHFSALLLALVGVGILAKFRWAVLGVACLLCTYGGFLFWQLYSSFFTDAMPFTGGMRAAFLIATWVVFTAAVLLRSGDAYKPVARAWFAVINNGAFVVLFTLHLLDGGQGEFWGFAFIIGLVFLALSFWSREKLQIQGLSDVYLGTGVLMVTLGFITKLTGYSLPIVLAAEAALLGVAYAKRWVPLLLLAGGLVGAIAAFYALGEASGAGGTVIPGLVATAFFALATWAIQFLKPEAVEERKDGIPSVHSSAIVYGFLTLGTAATSIPIGLNDRPGIAAALLIGMGVVAVLLLWEKLSALALPCSALTVVGAFVALGVADSDQTVTLASLALGGFVLCVLPVRHAVVAGVPLIGIALIGFGLRCGDLGGVPAVLLVVPALALAASYYLRRRNGVEIDPRLKLFTTVFTLVSLGAFFAYLTDAVQPDYLSAAWAGLALAVFAVGMLTNDRTTRLCALAILGAAFLRVLVRDVWLFSTAMRFVSFFALGIALVALGFVYNRYQEKIRKFL